jgi:dihydroorotase-like cyclic amidohydrolase
MRRVDSRLETAQEEEASIDSNNRSSLPVPGAVDGVTHVTERSRTYVETTALKTF